MPHAPCSDKNLPIKDLALKLEDISSDEIQNLAEIFLDTVFSKINANQIVIEPHWDIDHLCFRVETEALYEDFKRKFSKLGELLAETNIKGRPIATFELQTPIRYKDWLIKLIELPAPKRGKSVKTGFEHFEFVVDKCLEDISKKYPWLEWDRSGLEKIFNSELELSLGNSAIKFHNLSLKSVINFEQRPKMAILVSELKLLEIFKNHQPFIAGTGPLAIDLPNSDLDLLVSFKDPNDFKKICQQGFSSLPEYEISIGEINNESYCLCRFSYKGIPVEIFCSKLSTFSQNGYLHFNSEEKILKYGPMNWAEEIIKLKSSGIKTEPAFARLLQKTEMDAYQFVLNLQKKSIQELRSIIRSSMI